MQMLNKKYCFIPSLLLLCMSAASAATIYIDPTASHNGSGTLTDPYQSWNSVNFAAGNTYLQKRGTVFNGIISIAAKASSANPIIIGGYAASGAKSDGARPAIVGFVDFNGASYVTLNGYTVSGGTLSSVILRNGASHVTVEYSQLLNAPVAGVNITNDAGGSNMILNNYIAGHGHFGVGVYEISNAQGAETRIQGNTIENNQSHGIEIKGNRFIVSYNTLNKNGTAIGGSSGIHVYAGGYGGDPFKDFGSYNTIAYNTVSGTQEHAAADGNGIELDQKTNNNLVQNNTCYGNAGAGINLYDASFNTIKDNLTYNNSLGGPKSVFFAELLLGGTTALNNTRGNLITGNTFKSTGARTFAVLVDPVAARQTNVMQTNTLENTTAGGVWSFNYQTGSDARFNQIKWPASGAGPDTIVSGH